ncbi:hypothetical protein LIER_16276 [Lithospermum erythrorhizon]|uniref:Uncharacterized protein n=1 Tax=Lithospermum erythrorhizon TaxID=34254 RepID=A0AAV3QBD8_LITER
MRTPISMHISSSHSKCRPFPAIPPEMVSTLPVFRGDASWLPLCLCPGFRLCDHSLGLRDGPTCVPYLGIDVVPSSAYFLPPAIISTISSDSSLTSSSLIYWITNFDNSLRVLGGYNTNFSLRGLYLNP